MAGCGTELQMHTLVTCDEYYSQLKERLENPKEADRYGSTLLHIAALIPIDNSTIVQLLIDRGADVNSTTLNGHTPLHFAVISRKLYAVDALIEAGASINSKDSSGRTALHFAVCDKQPDFLILKTDRKMLIAESLLRHPEINLNLADENGETPLMWAVKESDSKAVKALLKKGANIDIPDKNQRTPLHVALSAQNPFEEVVMRLFTNGARIYHQDSFRQTPIDILIRNVRDVKTFLFAASCVRLFALRYNVTRNLKRKLGQIPSLLNFLNDFCKEVRLMKKVVIYDKVTLHDFTLDCFQKSTTRVKDPVREIYIPVVEILLTEAFRIYNDFILCRLSKADLHSVLKRTVGESLALDLVPQDASNLIIMDAIRQVYDENVELKGRLFELKQSLTKKM